MAIGGMTANVLRLLGVAALFLIGIATGWILHGVRVQAGDSVSMLDPTFITEEVAPMYRSYKAGRILRELRIPVFSSEAVVYIVNDSVRGAEYGFMPSKPGDGFIQYNGKGFSVETWGNDDDLFVSVDDRYAHDLRRNGKSVEHK